MSVCLCVCVCACTLLLPIVYGPELRKLFFFIVYVFSFLTFLFCFFFLSCSFSVFIDWKYSFCVHCILYTCSRIRYMYVHFFRHRHRTTGRSYFHATHFITCLTPSSNRLYLYMYRCTAGNHRRRCRDRIPI